MNPAHFKTFCGWTCWIEVHSFFAVPKTSPRGREPCHSARATLMTQLINTQSLAGYIAKYQTSDGHQAQYPFAHAAHLSDLPSGHYLRNYDLVVRRIQQHVQRHCCQHSQRVPVAHWRSSWNAFAVGPPLFYKIGVVVAWSRATPSMELYRSAMKS